MGVEMELMGIIVDVNIDIFDIESSGKRSLNRVGKYAVVTFAKKYLFHPSDGS